MLKLMVQLNVHGYPTEESDSLTDPDLLMEVLEAREELEEAESAEQVDALREANHGTSVRPSPCDPSWPCIRGK